jgi:hypothetical protein
MTTITRALFVAMIVSSTMASSRAQADSRFVGMFYSNGTGVLLDTGPKVPKPKVVMPAGHVAGADLELPNRTRDRFSSKTSQLTSIMDAANKRFAEKLAELRQSPALVRIAKEVAPKYNVDAASIVASVLTELTFNNDYSMKLQNMAAYIPSQSFYPGANEVKALFSSPQLKICNPGRSDYWSWVCLNVLWDNNVLTARGSQGLVAPYAYIKMSPTELSLIGKISPQVAFLPVGMSFGPGQISLFRALMASEDVTRISGGKFPRVTIDDMPAVQRMVSELEPTVHIIAATLGRSIYAYRKYARIDISQNLGLLASIFNLGYEVQRATKLMQANDWAKVENYKLPRENYFGYFANEHEKEIRALVNETK